MPIPDLSPEERARKRLAWRNERTLYKRTCSHSGKDIISIFDSNSKFPVYNQDFWWSDEWDALDYGKSFDFNKTFFNQFIELFELIPQNAMNCPKSINSEYTNQSEYNQDCYMLFCCNSCKDCLYSMWLQGCTDCIDCTYLEKCQFCYEILNAKNCYQCFYSENLNNCSDIYFSNNLIGCKNCIGCINLNNQEYCIFNKKYDKTEYNQILNKLEFNSFNSIELFKERFLKFTNQFPFKYYHGYSNENFSGDYLENNKNTFNSFNCRHSENLFHGRDAWKARNCIDLTETLEQDYCIQLEGSYLNNIAVAKSICRKDELAYI